MMYMITNSKVISLLFAVVKLVGYTRHLLQL